MPWETGIMKQIFDSHDDSIFPTVVPSVVRDDIALPFYSFAVKVLPGRHLALGQGPSEVAQVFEVLGFPGTLGFSLLCRAGARCDWSSE